MAKKRKRVDYDSPLMSIYSPEYQYLMRQNAPENANVAGLGDWFSNLFNRNKQQPDYHRNTVSMGLGTENSLQGVGNGGTDWNNQNFSLTGQSNQQQFDYNPNQELTTAQQYQYSLIDPENLTPKQTEEQTKQSTQPSTGSNVNWGGVIGAAATAAANAMSNGGSAADIVANAMGIPVLAKMWKANTEWGDARIKEAQEKIANPSVKYIQDANDIQGAGQGIKLNNQDLNLIDTSGMLNTNNWKKFSSGRGSGTWWKNMATAQLQGAASGSVGGPWGALGGATAGLLGSIGGLFGSKKRAKRAMKQYNDNMTTLRNYATMENQRRITERNLSNQNMLSNAMTSQKLQDMANIRAYGGNLFDGGGDLTEEQQMVLADIQADPRILFTPKYSQWRDYIRRTSPDYLDRLYTSLPYEQQQDIYQNDREAWGALSNNAKGNFGSSKVRNESNEISPYVAGGLGATLAAPIAIEALGSYALPYTYNGVVSGLNAASDYIMGTRFGQAVAPYVSNLLKPAADATFAFEGAKNFASSEGFNKTWNHFANGEIANGITSGLGDALDLLMVGQGKPLLNVTKEAATAIKKGGKYVKKQITASSRAKKLLDELDERMIQSDRQLAALNDDRLKADRLKYKAKQFFPSPSTNIPIPSYIDYQDKFYKRIKNLLENNKIDEAETLLSNVNSPYKITQLPNGEYGLPLYSETPYSEGFLLGEKKMYNPSTGQYDSYYLDPSGLPSNIGYFTGTGRKSVKIDGSSIPEDYRNTISKNIDYITNELYPGTSPFGSSVLASEGNLYTNPHDFEVYMPESMLSKYKTNEWNQISPDTYTFTHPEVGDIDFNILRETPEGFATGQRSWQLASRQHPDWYKQYADKRFKDIAKGVKRKPIEQDPLPWTPQELLENANPNVNTMTDALFANKNAKHQNRRLYYLNNAKIDDLKASINEYGNYVMGGNYKPSDVPLSAFNDPSTNSKILEKMGIKGIDKSVTNDPERMKTLFEYSILHKQIYGRGVTESNIASQGWDAVGSWFPETTGGTVHGVGLNTVRGGNSGHGNVYSILQPKSIEGITDPFDAIKVLDESVGIKELSNSERQQIRDAINNLGIDIYLPKEFSLNDVLRGTRGQKGVKYQQLNKAIEKITNTSGITDKSEYGTGIYTSLWDVPQSKSANIIFGDLDRPNNPELLNTRKNTNPLFGEFLDRRVTDKVEKAINDSKMNSGRIYDFQSTADKMYDVSDERYNRIDSYRDLINDRIRNVATKLAKAQSNAETVKYVLPSVGIGGAVSGGIAALSNYKDRRSQIIDDAKKAGIDMRMKRGEETIDEYYDRLERELIQMGFYGQEALEEYNQNNNIGYAMGGHLYTDLSPNMMNLWNNKQQIDQQKAMNQQFSLGLGNSSFVNKFETGGQMTSADVPNGMQYYANGGTHEENPYGGIQVGQDQQGNPNLVEEGEFRYGDYIFSDRIPVDYSILSDFNVEKGKSNRNTKNNPTYAELAKKTADKYKDLNDKISKDSLNKQLDRLQRSQEAQKFKEQQDQQYADYTNALKSPTQGNPMYGNMKYNGMGNANQGLNAGVDEGMGNAMDNSDLSNVNRSGNPMMAAYGGNLFALGSAVNNPKKILPWEEPMNLEYRVTVPQSNSLAGININTNPYYGNVRDHQQLLINNGYDIVPDGVYGPATENAMTDFRHKIYGQSQAGTQTVNNPNSNSTYSSDKKYVKYEGPVNQNSPESQTGEVTNSTKTNSSANDVVPVENLGEVDRQQGNLAGSSPFDWNRYNEAGRYGQLAKGLIPNLMNWSGKTNWNYDPNWKPSNELEALGHSSYSSRIADHLGDYIAPNLMDVERLNNQAMAQTAAQQRGTQNIGGGNRGFVAAQNAATDYNGQMGIGNNYVTSEQYNADQKQRAAEFNRATNQFNAQANNDMYKDNLTAWMQGRQMDIQAMEAANKERQYERQYKDRTDRDAALNKQRDLAAMFDNQMNFLADEAEYNRRLNDMNSRRNSRFWYDKKEGWQERNDNGFTSKLRDAIDGAILSSDDFNQISKIQNNDKYTDDEKIAMIQNIADSARARNKQENDAVAAEKKKEIQNYLSEAQSYFNLLNSLQDYQPWNNAKSRYSDPNYFTYTDDLTKEIAKHRMDELQNMWFNYTTRYNPNAVEKVPTPQTTKTSAYGGKLKSKREYDYMSI